MLLERLGPYKIGRVLGRGGMGTVYEGISESDEDTVAIKVLTDFIDEEEDAEVRLRFESEIETLKRLRHPNIVRLTGFGEEQGQLYYVMELVSGVSLQQELKKKRLFQWFEAAKIGLDICHALRHAHDRGVIHRDIKPANILLDQEGNVKLSDFGIARFFGSQQITDIHSIIGTLEFMSPEQALAYPISSSVDLYSLGCVLYILLTGKPPYSAHSLPEMLHKYKTSTPALISSFRNDVPDDLGYLITDLLRIRPEDRPRNALLVIKRLQALLQALIGDPETIKVLPMSSDDQKQPQELVSPSSGNNFRPNSYLRHAQSQEDVVLLGKKDSAEQGTFDLNPNNNLLTDTFKRQGDKYATLKSAAVGAEAANLPISTPPQSKEDDIDKRLSDTKSASFQWDNSQSPPTQSPQAEQSSITSPAAQDQNSAEYPSVSSTKASNTTTRFIAVGERTLDPFEEEHRVSRPVVSLPITVTSTLLIIIGLIVFYMLQPPSPEVLYERITSAIKEDDDSEEYSLSQLRSVQKNITIFLSSYPNHPSAEQVRYYQDELDLLEHERRLERRTQFSGLRTLSPVERAYVEVLSSSPNDPEEMIIKLHAFIDVFQTGEPSSVEPIRPQRMASSPVEVCVELARRRLKKLEHAVVDINAEQKQVLQRRLDEATGWDAIYPSHADDIRQGIIELYQNHRWAKEIVDEAKQQLKE